ncbi:MAG: hypothetical protein JO307_01530 [Bryobacterales bacterium]|nr:hypothetical protein [Bryobacterales bacterium]
MAELLVDEPLLEENAGAKTDNPWAGAGRTGLDHRGCERARSHEGFPNLNGSGASDQLVASAARIDRQALEQIFVAKISRDGSQHSRGVDLRTSSEYPFG